MSKIILILGAGKMVGLSIANLFSTHGYKVALASRSGTPLGEGKQFLSIKADFTDPESMEGVFETVKRELGVPNVVVFNAYQSTFNPQPFSLPLSTFSSGVAISITSAFAALKYSIEGFDTLPADVKKTFIYTGNKLNVEPWPQLLDLGVGKAAGAHMVVAAQKGYGGSGYRFYYADERKADGDPVNLNINGDNHAQFFWKLACASEQGPCLATFVGSEFVDFGGA
ncbi:hypothetical protein HYFRA_00009891 [Hymenoscyphus fraxineus]|uniref:NAD(P)-binding protein n=1 Tax=Hymenoscyphus fraxineus TaxID=746836 RepID=A0A9N9L324_9HELO|nr:hypothetical protein HYFRA_00009891 [Hymenoscyphus fraxineus]